MSGCQIWTLTSQKSSYIILQHYLLPSRNLLYTGLTRAKQLAILVGLTKAIGISVKRLMDWQRYTTLADRLKSLSVSPTVGSKKISEDANTLLSVHILSSSLSLTGHLHTNPPPPQELCRQLASLYRSMVYYNLALGGVRVPISEQQLKQQRLCPLETYHPGAQPALFTGTRRSIGSTGNTGHAAGALAAFPSA